MTREPERLDLPQLTDEVRETLRRLRRQRQVRDPFPQVLISDYELLAEMLLRISDRIRECDELREQRRKRRSGRVA